MGLGLGSTELVILGVMGLAPVLVLVLALRGNRRSVDSRTRDLEEENRHLRRQLRRERDRDRDAD